MPKCPYCNSPLTPARYCATCRLTVTPTIEAHGYGRYPRESARRGNLASAQARRKETQR